MEPPASTDSTMPMWRPPQTIRSPGCGVLPAGCERPVRWAQSATALTAPKPWPCSPSGVPACLAAHETKYAHHGPTPEPAVAWRYSAIRGESLEPGGCSVWPTSPLAAWIIAWVPPPPAAGAVSEGEKAVLVMPGVAFAGIAADVCAPSAAWEEEDHRACGPA